jgi:hypothetical protein
MEEIDAEHKRFLKEIALFGFKCVLLSLLSRAAAQLRCHVTYVFASCFCGSSVRVRILNRLPAWCVSLNTKTKH